jgi:hypothetical protein
MEISLDFGKAWKAGLGLFVALAFLLIGRAASPVTAEGPAILTPDRWQAAALARKAGVEIVRLAADAQALHDLAARETPDAIQAMLLAQRIYAGHRQGTTATAPARQALIAAAEATARYASGGVPRQTAVDAVNAALERIRVLTPMNGAESNRGPLADDSNLGSVRPGATPTPG